MEKSKGDYKAVLTNAYKSVTKEVCSTTIDCSFSGTTLVSTLIVGNKIYCANVGDSRAVLARKPQGAKKWVVDELSHDHKPDLPKEKARIEKQGGRVEPLLDEYDNAFGPPRVWLKDEDIPGLAMSRSIGDQVAARVGVTAEPEIIEATFSSEDKYILLASDGIWEFISNEEVIHVVI